MGHKHTKAEILAGALEAALADGLSQLTYGRLAKRLAMHDRTIVYYFPTKADLITEVIVSMGLALQGTLSSAISAPVDGHADLIGQAWPVLARPETDRIFALFFEANGLAAAGRAPYSTLVPVIIEAWLDWMAGFVAGTADRRRTEAEAALAVIDGLLLLRQLAGPDAAHRAAVTLGLAVPRVQSSPA